MKYDHQERLDLVKAILTQVAADCGVKAKVVPGIDLKGYMHARLIVSGEGGEVTHAAVVEQGPQADAAASGDADGVAREGEVLASWAKHVLEGLDK